MSWQAIRDQVVTLVGQVSGIGRVYGYLRYTKHPGRFKELFVDPADGRLRAAMVTRRGAPPRRLAHKVNEIRHNLRVVMVDGMDDVPESELAHRTRVEAVRRKLDNAEIITGAMRQEPAAVVVEDLREFGDYLCWYSEVECPLFEEEILP